MLDPLNTERLHWRPLTYQDSAFLIRLMNTPGWLAFIGDRHVHNDEEACRYLDAGPLKSYKTYGFGLGLMSLQSTNTPIGLCGLLQRDYLDGPDLGFAILPEHEGHGLVTEMASAILHKAFGAGHSPIYAITLPANAASARVLEKLGFTYERNVRNPLGETLALFGVERP